MSSPITHELIVYKLIEIENTKENLKTLINKIVVFSKKNSKSMDFMGKMIEINKQGLVTQSDVYPPDMGVFDINGIRYEHHIPDNMNPAGRYDDNFKYLVYEATKQNLDDELINNNIYIACWTEPGKSNKTPKCREIINIRKVPGSPFVYIITTKYDGVYRVDVNGTEVDPPKGGKRSKKRRTKRNKKSRYSRRKNRK